MRRALLGNASLFTRSFIHSSPRYNPTSTSSLAPLTAATRSPLRFFSSENDSSNENPKPAPETNLANPVKKDVSVEVEDVNNKGNDYFYYLMCRWRKIHHGEGKLMGLSSIHSKPS